MNNEEPSTSSDLIRWLKMLTLPLWVKLPMALIMVAGALSALWLMWQGIRTPDNDAVGHAVALMTIGLPTSLVALALLFGDSGGIKLRRLTRSLLDKEIPECFMKNFARTDHAGSAITLTHEVHGCMADYHIHFTTNQGAPAVLDLRLEVNVRKVNVVVWLPGTEAPKTAREYFESVPGLRSCLLGATREGYELNEAPITDLRRNRWGCVFIKSLSEDFLVSPAHRLYFAQDLAFFARGLLETFR
jgi:hypothetical protein